MDKNCHLLYFAQELLPIHMISNFLVDFTPWYSNQGFDAMEVTSTYPFILLTSAVPVPGMTGDGHQAKLEYFSHVGNNNSLHHSTWQSGISLGVLRLCA